VKFIFQLIILMKNLIWIVFEYNGVQHYVFPNYFHGDLTKLGSFITGIINDLLKISLLYSNGIVFFEFPYWISLKMNEPNKIRNFIYKEINTSFNNFQ